MTPILERIDHIHVYVADRAAAQQWYTRVLGLAPVPELAFWAGTGPLTLGNPSGSVHIALFERSAQACRSTIAFAVDATGFLAWRAHLATVLGRAVEAVDHDVSWSLYFADPDANPFEITSYDHAAIRASL